MEYSWDPQAQSDLQGIYEFICYRKHEPESALYVANSIVDRAQSLVDYPNKYPVYVESGFSDTVVRSTVIWSYRIVYEVRGNAVRITRILHTSRNPFAKPDFD